MKKILYSVLFVLFFLPATYAQLFTDKAYPKGYFQWPVRAKIALAANFGELRNNHYHMGLDCKTDRKENMPILAAADGYVAKIKIEPFGFGRAIYINHPNGLTTLYAHLNDFYPELEKYVTSQQYKLQQWKVMLDVPANLLPVKKGDFIAYSGNTGGSQGPHLHFEIRDTQTDKVLNPLLFNFPVADMVPPDILRLAVYDRSKSTYEQVPLIYPLKKVQGKYQAARPVITVPSGLVSFAFTAYDRYTGSTNQNGIFRAELLHKGKTVAGFEMDSISYDETRYLNAHIDHPFRSRGGSYLEHLSKLPGNLSGIYHLAPGHDGVLDLTDGNIHPVTIKVYDANGNVSTLDIRVQAAARSASATQGGADWFSPGMVNIFERDDISFYLPENALYDAFRFSYSRVVSATGSVIHRLHNPSVPVHVYFPVRIKADFPLADTGRIIMKRSYGSKDDFKKAQYEYGWYKASFRELGDYQLIPDREAPTVTAIGFRDGMNAAALRRLVFAVKDNTEEIALFRAELDGQWLRFSNDKGKNFVYVFDDYCTQGPHELKITVADLAGNQTVKTYRFTR